MLGKELRNLDRPHARSVAIGASVSTHAVVAALAIWLSTLPRSFAVSEQARSAPRSDVIWIASPGPGGGGGGGGNQTTTAAPVRHVGRDRLTVPTVRSEPKPIETPKAPPPIAPLAIPAQPVAAAIDIAPGVTSPVPSAETTQGPGSRGGAGSGSGTGSGEGQGSGLGPGVGGGTGGGAYRPGSGVSMPKLVREVTPNYTAAALRAKVQGIVVVDCVVLPDGTIGDVKIIQSLDKIFGVARDFVFAHPRQLGPRGWLFSAPSIEACPIG
jgi:protein TonB